MSLSIARNFNSPWNSISKEEAQRVTYKFVILLDCWKKKKKGKMQKLFFLKTTNYFANSDKISTSFKNEKNAVSIEVANIELRWEFLFFLQTPSWQQQKKHISKKVTRFCIIYVYLKVSSAGLRTKMHSEKKMCAFT